MLEIGLTGSRKSGKDGIVKLFAQLGAPVFDADAIMKYLLNYRPGVVQSVHKAFGKDYVFGDFINPIAFDTDEKFGALIDLIEFELFEAYHKFKLRYKFKKYIIFHSSMIYERNYQTKFDYVINVFAPKEDRIERYRMETGDKLSLVHNLFSCEMADISKNQMSNFIIHNYLDAPDVLRQVQNINDNIITKYDELKSEDLDAYSHHKNIFTF